MNPAKIQAVLSRQPGDPATRYTNAEIFRRTMTRPDARASTLAFLNHYTCACYPEDSPRRRTCIHHTATERDVAEVVRLAVLMLEASKDCKQHEAMRCAVEAVADKIRDREAAI